jgi:hypothetical protein
MTTILSLHNLFVDVNGLDWWSVVTQQSTYHHQCVWNTSVSGICVTVNFGHYVIIFHQLLSRIRLVEVSSSDATLKSLYARYPQFKEIRL